MISRFVIFVLFLFYVVCFEVCFVSSCFVVFVPVCLVLLSFIFACFSFVIRFDVFVSICLVCSLFTSHRGVATSVYSQLRFLLGMTGYLVKRFLRDLEDVVAR